MNPALLGLRPEHSQAEVNQFDPEGLSHLIHQHDVVYFYIGVDYANSLQGIESCCHLQEIIITIILVISFIYGKLLLGKLLEHKNRSNSYKYA